MQSRSRSHGGARLVFVLLTVFLLSGCFSNEEIVLPPEPEAQGQSETGLGPGVRPLSFGLGEKGAPSWNPSGDRIAFTMDDYVVEKEPFSRDFERQTTKDFKAQTLTWMPSGKGLTILGSDAESDSSDTEGLYRAVTGEDSLEVSRVTNGVRAMVSGPPDSQWTLLVVEDGNDGSRLALMESGNGVQPYKAKIGSEVTGVSASPNGEMAVLAARNPASGRFEIYTFSLSEDRFQRAARLATGLEIFGAPQWTDQGIYYVAGEPQEADGSGPAPYALYQVPTDSSTPELAPGVGAEFVASSLKRDPTGNRLAVIGHRNPSSPENLYILDPASERLEAATSNTDMQIKTGAEDLTWSPDGGSVVIIARAIVSEPKVYSAPANALVKDFYNLYRVPTEETTSGGRP